MFQTPLTAPFILHVLSSLVEPFVAISADDTGPEPVPAGGFTVSFGDGQIDILSQTMTAPVSYTLTTGDASLTVVPAQEI